MCIYSKTNAAKFQNFIQILFETKEARGRSNKKNNKMSSDIWDQFLI